MIIGRARITSEITQESKLLSFGAVYMGDYTMNAGVREYQEEADYAALNQELVDPFRRGDLPEIIRILDRHFGNSTYSLRSIFKDDQRKIVDLILKSTVAEAESAYRHLYESHAHLMHFLADINVPQPRAYQIAAQFALNSSLREAFEDVANFDINRVNLILEAARWNNVVLDADTLGYTLRRTIRRLAEHLLENPEDLALMKRLEGAAGLAKSLPFEVGVRRAQNIYYQLLQRKFPEFVEKGDEAWVTHFVGLGNNLAVRVDKPVPQENLLEAS
jgi:hypothetical protein